ncbi:MAG: hypothetical protein M3Y70_04385 [Pseudomonadota bacterium]|nr:hypothetical protein [Pseudomonadota bacterium]
MSTGRLLSIIASVVVLATLVGAIVVMDSPAQQRERRMDDRRVQDLQRLVGAARAYHQAHRQLPADMAALAGQPGLRLSTADPSTGAPYEYEPTGKRSFRVCASFSTDTATAEPAPAGPDSWNHAAGRHCFGREINTD